MNLQWDNDGLQKQKDANSKWKNKVSPKVNFYRIPSLPTHLLFFRFGSSTSPPSTTLPNILCRGRRRSTCSTIPPSQPRTDQRSTSANSAEHAALNPHPASERTDPPSKPQSTQGAATSRSYRRRSVGRVTQRGRCGRADSGRERIARTQEGGRGRAVSVSRESRESREVESGGARD